jgi:hypothetical protein
MASNPDQRGDCEPSWCRWATDGGTAVVSKARERNTSPDSQDQKHRRSSDPPPAWVCPGSGGGRQWYRMQRVDDEDDDLGEPDEALEEETGGGRPADAVEWAPYRDSFPMAIVWSPIPGNTLHVRDLRFPP